MKSLLSMPAFQPKKGAKTYFYPEGPVPVMVEPSEPMRPVEIRRYVRTLRETRRFTFNNEFLYL
jgi:hypothetical protein